MSYSSGCSSKVVAMKSFVTNLFVGTMLAFSHPLGNLTSTAENLRRIISISTKQRFLLLLIASAKIKKALAGVKIMVVL